MTPIEILTLTIAIAFPALGIMGTISAVLYSNKRIEDLGLGVNKRIDDFRVDVNKRIDDLRDEMKAMEKRLIQHIDNAFTHMELLLRLHEAEHHKKD